jgi:hypothetical protein
MPKNTTIRVSFYSSIFYSSHTQKWAKRDNSVYDLISEERYCLSPNLKKVCYHVTMSSIGVRLDPKYSRLLLFEGDNGAIESIDYWGPKDNGLLLDMLEVRSLRQWRSIPREREHLSLIRVRGRTFKDNCP